MSGCEVVRPSCTGERECFVCGLVWTRRACDKKKAGAAALRETEVCENSGVSPGQCLAHPPKVPWPIRKKCLAHPLTNQNPLTNGRRPYSRDSYVNTLAVLYHSLAVTVIGLAAIGGGRRMGSEEARRLPCGDVCGEAVSAPNQSGRGVLSTPKYSSGSTRTLSRWWLVKCAAGEIASPSASRPPSPLP